VLKDELRVTRNEGTETRAFLGAVVDDLVMIEFNAKLHDERNIAWPHCVEARLGERHAGVPRLSLRGLRRGHRELFELFGRAPAASALRCRSLGRRLATLLLPRPLRNGAEPLPHALRQPAPEASTGRQHRPSNNRDGFLRKPAATY